MQERKEWEAKLQQARTEEAEAGAKRCASMAEKADALKRQHANDVRTLQDQLTTEKAQWQEEVVEKFSREAAAKEERVRAELLRERNEQLDALMRKLAEENMHEVARLEAEAKEREEAAAAGARASEARSQALRAELAGVREAE